MGYNLTLQQVVLDYIYEALKYPAHKHHQAIRKKITEPVFKKLPEKFHEKLLHRILWNWDQNHDLDVVKYFNCSVIADIDSAHFKFADEKFKDRNVKIFELINAHFMNVQKIDLRHIIEPYVINLNELIKCHSQLEGLVISPRSVSLQQPLPCANNLTSLTLLFFKHISIRNIKELAPCLKHFEIFGAEEVDNCNQEIFESLVELKILQCSEAPIILNASPNLQKLRLEIGIATDVFQDFVWTSLKELTLKEFSGINEKKIRRVSNCAPNLEALWFENCEVELQENHIFTSLKNLRVSSLKPSAAFFDELSTITPNLNSLRLSKTRINNLKKLNFPDLEELWLKSCVDIPPCQFIELNRFQYTLSRLDLCQSSITTLEGLYFPYLTTLKIWGCNKIPPSQFSYLKDLGPRITHLDASRTQIDSLKNLPKLIKKLWLLRTEVKNLECDLPDLEEIHLSSIDKIPKNQMERVTEFFPSRPYMSFN